MCLVLCFVSDWFCVVSVSLLCVVLFVLVFVVLLRARTMAPKAATIKARHGLTKKPASNVQPVKGLTTKQVTKHNKGNDSSALGDKMALFIKQCQQPGATVGVVEGFLKTLPANEQQLVWKEFEKHRVMAKSDSYQWHWGLGKEEGLALCLGARWQGGQGQHLVERGGRDQHRED